MANYTDITVLLDRSGSMVSIKGAMEGGFREFLHQHRAVPSSRLTLVQFDTDNAQEVVYTAKPIVDAPQLDITPRGGTPLLDALCRAIDATGQRLAGMADADRPERVLFVIITDGQENASHEFKRGDVRDRVTRQAGTYRWQFVYLGANQDAFAEAASFGIAKGSTAAYAASAAGTQNVMRSMAMNTVSYAGQHTNSVKAFSDDQREEALEKDEKSI
jgi:Mg-chelatase subunit ChlD